MPTPRVSNAVRFGPFTLDLKSGELHKSGRKICLQEQPFRLLTVLIERPGEVVTREELQNRLWPDNTTVEFGHSINSAVKRLRDVLGDNADKPKYVETVARRGYRFLPPVECDEFHPAPSAASVGEPPVKSPASNSSNPAPAITPSPLPEQRLLSKKRVKELLVALAFGALLTGFAVGSKRFHWFGQPDFERIHSLAVLPLENLSGDRGQDYFADGITDELISNLGKISALRVISRTSVMRYRGAQKLVQEIARDLHVDAVLEGTVLRSGNRVRITAHLIQAEPETQLWTENYEGDLGDIMVMQDDAARQIANEIRVKLTPQEQVRLSSARPVTSQAQEAYLKGRYLFSQRTNDGMRKSIAFLQQAIDLDSRYALAYAGLADSYLVLTTYGLLKPNEAYPKAEQAAKKALEIDDTLAEAHTALGFAQSCYERNWPAAEREFRRAIELNPSYPTAHMWYGEHLLIVGQADRAIAEFKRARDLDPLSLIVNASLGRALRDARHFDEAIEQCRKTIDLDPNFAHGHWCLGLSYLGKARNADAILEFQKARALGEGQIVLWSLAYAYGVAGRKPEARETLREFKQQSPDGYVSPYFMAGIYAGMGEKDQAFVWLDRAYEERDLMTPKLDPFLDSLRSDPRFRDLLRCAGLAQ